jgi:hypothetical protein
LKATISCAGFAWYGAAAIKEMPSALFALHYFLALRGTDAQTFGLASKESHGWHAKAFCEVTFSESGFRDSNGHVTPLVKNESGPPWRRIIRIIPTIRLAGQLPEENCVSF